MSQNSKTILDTGTKIDKNTEVEKFHKKNIGMLQSWDEPLSYTHWFPEIPQSLTRNNSVFLLKTSSVRLTTSDSLIHPSLVLLGRQNSAFKIKCKKNERALTKIDNNEKFLEVSQNNLKNRKNLGPLVVYAVSEVKNETDSDIPDLNLITKDKRDLSDTDSLNKTGSIFYGIKNKKKAKKGTQDNEESDESKFKKFTIIQIMRTLQVFVNDTEKFQVVSRSIRLLLPLLECNLIFLEKPLEDLNKNNQVILRLIEIGFEILTRESNFFSIERISWMMENEFCFGKMPSEEELQYVIQSKRILEFNFEDVIYFARATFNLHQWDRFGYLIRLLDIFSKTFEKEKYPLLVSSSLEVSLRQTIINFYVVTHTERKVAFGANVPTFSISDLAVGRFNISNNVCEAILNVLRLASKCAENEFLKNQSFGLILNAAQILWKYIEPFIRDLTSIQDQQNASGLLINNIIVKTLISLHNLLNIYPMKDVLFGLNISEKLALILECLDDFDEAVKILKQTEIRISFCRENLGEGSNTLKSVTCNISIHRNLREKYEHHDFVNLGIHNIDTKITNVTREIDFNSSLRRELHCKHVLILGALYRCEMKLELQNQINKFKKSKEQRLRLTNKKILQNLILKPNLSDKFIQSRCGESTVLKMILLTEYALYAPGFTTPERSYLIQKSCEYLNQEEKREFDLLKQSIETTEENSRELPPPVFVCRTKTSITIRPQKNCDKFILSTPIFWYRAHCKNILIGNTVTLSDNDYEGSGEFVRNTSDIEFTISGLEPNSEYIFAVSAFSKNKKMIDTIGKTSISILCTLPLPITFCWTRIAQVAYALGLLEYFELAKNYLWKSFLKSSLNAEMLCSFNTRDVNISLSSVFELDNRNLRASAEVNIQAFIDIIHKNLSNSFDINLKLPKQCEVLARCPLDVQMMHLEASKECLVALALSNSINDSSRAIKSVIECFLVSLPVLKLGFTSPFLQLILKECHKNFMFHSFILENERSREIVNIFIPLTYFLVENLVRIKKIDSAAKIIEDSFTYINSNTFAGDFRIFSSAFLEQNWFGTTKKPKKIIYGKDKKIINDFIHHAILATSEDIYLGYDEARKTAEIMIEKIDSLIAFQPARYPFNFYGFMTETYLSILGVSKYLNCSILITSSSENRCNLESNTTLRDLYRCLQVSNPESVALDLNRFKKNPRYPELLTKVIAWCLLHYNVESAQRLCQELIDWIDRRNNAILMGDFYGDEDESAVKYYPKKRKRNLFSDRSPYLLISPIAHRSRQKKRVSSYYDDKETWRRKQENNHNKMVLNDEVIYHGRLQNDNTPQIFSNPSEIIKQQNTELERSRSSSPLSSQRELSIERPKISNRSELSYKKGIQHRQTLINVLKLIDVDAADKAARSLDNLLSSTWRSKRYHRRLRAVLEFESSSRSDLSLLQGNSIFMILEKDILTKEVFNGKRMKDKVNFELGVDYLLIESSIIDMKNSTVEVVKGIPDMMQYYVQSIVLAGRNKNWIRVLNGCRQLLDSTRFLTKYNISGPENFRMNFWRAFFVSCEYLFEFLETAEIETQSIDGGPENFTKFILWDILQNGKGDLAKKLQ
ncbi:hypothetical protein HK096_009523 [Nowakowskiella sp. JEL0078]|nr:hypothetical protein HK096_009523 [Nowakowskiella sp. JEL0078]